MVAEPFRDSPPDSDGLTDYDRSHLTLYLRILDAAAEGADWREVVRVLFDIDPEKEPERARGIHDSHLARARWMTTTGYRHLLREPPDSPLR
ncbi:MAG: DUF2285 domain-containing protein [Hyphomicrobiaceae bacterium]